METEQFDEASVLTKSVIRAADSMGLSDAELASALGLKVAEVHSIFSGRFPIEAESTPGRLALQLVRIYLALCTLVGPDARLLDTWTHSHNEALGAEPANRIQTPDGMSQVLSYVEAMSQAT